mmetsp:Transcript_45154/g.146731  ORF Transcript_45154/g.146731 Transcript_45154/m.146731 type:complete len:305 (-) Transcript_45154:189-1103(-)
MAVGGPVRDAVLTASPLPLLPPARRHQPVPRRGRQVHLAGDGARARCDPRRVCGERHRGRPGLPRVRARGYRRLPPKEVAALWRQADGRLLRGQGGGRQARPAALTLCRAPAGSPGCPPAGARGRAKAVHHRRLQEHQRPAAQPQRRAPLPGDGRLHQRRHQEAARGRSGRGGRVGAARLLARAAERRASGQLPPDGRHRVRAPLHLVRPRSCAALLGRGAGAAPLQADHGVFPRARRVAAVSLRLPGRGRVPLSAPDIPRPDRQGGDHHHQLRRQLHRDRGAATRWKLASLRLLDLRSRQATV